MMRILFVTICIVVAARIIIINLTTQDSNIDIQVMQMIIFILTVLVAYAFVWRRGGLEWD